jgi:hypothetical protein
MRAADHFTNRLAGWFVTGPPGHFVSGLLDWYLAAAKAFMRRLS